MTDISEKEINQICEHMILIPTDGYSGVLCHCEKCGILIGYVRDGDNTIKDTFGRPISYKYNYQVERYLKE